MSKVNKKLVLERGGKLFLHYDEYNEEKDVPNVAKTFEFQGMVPSCYLHELDFETGEGVLMEDVFLFLKKDLAYWEIVIGNHVSEYVEESFKTFPEPEDKEIVINSVYLSWIMESDKMDGKKTVSLSFPVFCGKGTSYGETCDIGFGGSPVSSLNKLPIEIKNNLTVIYENYDHKFLFKMKNSDDFLKSVNHRTLLERIFPFLRRWKYWFEEAISRKSYDLGDMKMTFFQFLYGIFYELSFHGSPSENKAFFDSLSDKVRDFKD